MTVEFFEPTMKELLHMNIDTTANDYLYHYTRYSGTVGILNSGCFLVSRSDALDDATEIVHIKKVLNCVSRILKKNTIRNINERDENGFFWGKIIYYLEFLECNFNNDNTMKDFDIYVLSMTEIEGGILKCYMKIIQQTKDID